MKQHVVAKKVIKPAMVTQLTENEI